MARPGEGHTYQRSGPQHLALGDPRRRQPRVLPVPGGSLACPRPRRVPGCPRWPVRRWPCKSTCVLLTDDP